MPESSTKEKKKKKWFLYVENSHNIHRTEGYIVRIHTPFIDPIHQA